MSFAVGSPSLLREELRVGWLGQAHFSHDLATLRIEAATFWSQGHWSNHQAMAAFVIWRSSSSSYSWHSCWVSELGLCMRISWQYFCLNNRVSRHGSVWQEGLWPLLICFRTSFKAWWLWESSRQPYEYKLNSLATCSMTVHYGPVLNNQAKQAYA